MGELHVRESYLNKEVTIKTPTCLYPVLSRPWHTLFPLVGTPFPISLPLTSGVIPLGAEKQSLAWGTWGLWRPVKQASCTPAGLCDPGQVTS